MNTDKQPSEAAVEVINVKKTFGTGPGAFTALQDVSLSIRPNEFFTLLGPSGCGKTTLLRLIAGFEYPTSGRIELDGEDIAQYPPYQRPVNTVFQNYALFPHMSVERNIQFGLTMLGRPKQEIDERVSEVLSLVRLIDLRHRAISQISGGQQQRVALARALAPSPKVLLLDEPLSALDFKLRKEMQIELKRMQLETGITFVFVTHDQEEALTMSERIGVMSNGQLLQVGTPHEIYERPSSFFVASFIGETNFLTGELVSVDPDGDAATVKLDCGATIIAECDDKTPPAGACTVVCRPEHLQLQTATGTSPATDDQLHGVVETIVYSGTDTQHFVKLHDGSQLLVRQQNLRTLPGQQQAPLAEGDAVYVTLAPRIARILVDESAPARPSAAQPAAAGAL